MANPQKEHGYVQVATEIIEALYSFDLQLSNYEWRCLLFIFRRTYGWHKKEDIISLSQFSEFTKIKRQHVCRSLNKLVKKGVIIKKKGNNVVSYSFQKDYEEWDNKIKQVVPKQVVPKQVIGSPQTGNKVVPKQGHTKDIKDNKEKDRGSQPTFQKPSLQEIKDFCIKENLLFDYEKFFFHYESVGWRYGKNTIKNWHMSARLWARTEFKNKKDQPVARATCMNPL